MSVSKNRLSATSENGWFCSDGFAMGLSFVLHIVGSTSRLHDLHWFDGVDEYFNDTIAEHHHHDAAQLVARQRLQDMRSEFAQLDAAMAAALRLF